MLCRIQKVSPALFFCLAAVAFPQTRPSPIPNRRAVGATLQEQRAIRVFNAAKQSPLELAALLARMPKGADLHMHLSGAIYAETFIKDAVADGLCVNPKNLSFFKPVAATRSLPPQPVCGEGNVRAEDALKEQHLYDALIDSFSMRDFVPSAGTSNHDQFFATFARFDGIDESHTGEWLDEVAKRAAAQNEQYLEIMKTPTFSNAAALGYKLGWPAGAEREIQSDQLAGLRARLLSAGLQNEVAVDRKELSEALARRSQIENCASYDDYKKHTGDNHPMTWRAASVGCSVQIRWIYQILRGFPPQQVFAQTLLGFEVASVDPTVVGINFVMPEDGRISMRDYHLQMEMLAYLHSVYPRVHITLHAGELAPGMVPPQGLTFHIREAVELAHAERIGHGVDVSHEGDLAHDDPIEKPLQPLLKEMAQKHILVEVNLTSNDVILGIKGANHPLHAYIAAHVPFALSTDDEGVSRIDLTHEYVKAVLEQNLDYLELKQSARASIEHSFLPGESLWQKPDIFTRANSACATQLLGAANPTAKCRSFLASSEKAAQQWELENRYRIFESTLP